MTKITTMRVKDTPAFKRLMEWQDDVREAHAAWASAHARGDVEGVESALDRLDALHVDTSEARPKFRS